MAANVTIAITTDADLLVARQQVRELASSLNFSAIDTTLIATATSEIARNILVYAGRGEVALQTIERGSRRGLLVIARDRGPGIADIGRALEDGFSTAGSLGLGLPGAKRLMDDFAIESAPGCGTTVKMTKWAD
jgi:serine/threonine-protein kinase RsbT